MVRKERLENHSHQKYLLELENDEKWKNRDLYAKARGKSNKISVRDATIHDVDYDE
jgi:hypothetical protein